MLLNSPYITGSLTISDGIYIRSYENNSINNGVNVIGEIPTTDGNGCNIEYLVKSNLNYRVGNIMVVWDGSNIQFTEVTTIDLGNTSDVSLSLDINNGNVRFLATSISTGWVVKSLAKII
jgi:hypothetical protein